MDDEFVLSDTKKLPTHWPKLIVDPVGAKAKTDDLKAMIDKWGTAFEELAAAPGKPGAPKAK